MFEQLSRMEAAHDKAAILTELWNTKQFGFFHGTRFGLDPQTQFGLSSAPLIDESDDFAGEFAFTDFQLLIQNIVVNADQAAKMVRSAAEAANAKQWNAFYRKILLKKVSWITIREFNDFLVELSKKDIRAKEFLIKEWRLPGTIPGTLRDVKPPVMIEPHLQGQRVNLLLHESGKVECLDSDGMPLRFDTTLSERWAFSIVLDGVLVDQTLWVFDLIPMDQFNRGICEIPLVERCDVLNQMIGLFQEKAPNIRILPKVEFTEPDRAKLAEIKEMFIQQGYAGAVVKPMGSHYDRNNQSSWRIFKLS